MSGGDVWGTTSTTVVRSDEGVEDLKRCTGCNGLFRQPRGSGKTHAEVVPTVSCAPDAAVTTVQKANQWARR